jgi:hypothetical protein
MAAEGILMNIFAKQTFGNFMHFNGKIPPHRQAVAVANKPRLTKNIQT